MTERLIDEAGGGLFRCGERWATGVAEFIERRERLLLACGVAAAFTERGVWALLRTAVGAQGEARGVAVALATGRGYADAFRVGQGPTDHLMPTTPVFGGLVYSLLGVNTPAAEFILWTVATVLAVSSYLLFYRAFGRVGLPKWVRMFSFWLLCVAPTYVQQESSDFRLWDGALIAFLTALFLDRLLAFDQARVRTVDVLVMCVLVGFASFANAPMGLGLYACAALFCLLNLRGKKLTTALLAAPLALALFAVPWGIRNERVMGKFMPLRDNGGLELALAQYEGAAAPIEGRKRRLERYYQIHPVGPAYAKFSAMGEVAYNQELARETKRWMRDHPAQVLRIFKMHAGQIVTPPTWLFRLWGGGSLATLRALLASAVNALGLLGIAAGLALLHRRKWLYVALLEVIPLMPFLVFQPLPRYLYLFYAPLAFAAGGTVIALLKIADRSRASSQNS